jgi:hypothetical protein
MATADVLFVGPGSQLTFGGGAMAIAITVEPESDGVPASFFRLLVNGGVVATGLTFSQTHFAVSEVLLRIAFPDAADAGGRPFAKSEHRRGASCRAPQHFDWRRSRREFQRPWAIASSRMDRRGGEGWRKPLGRADRSPHCR